MKTDLLNSVSRSFHKVGFQLKKHSPSILVGVGIVGIVASTVLACKATTKVNGVVTEAKTKLDYIHDNAANTEKTKESEHAVKKELTKVYAKTGLELVKLYAPAVAVGSLSIASILASHHILNKRNLAISAAYAVVDKSFKDYRKNVKERFGDKTDFELRHNIKNEKVETTTTDENGNEKVEVKEMQVVDSVKEEYSDFARIFDELNPYYQKNAHYNKKFLKDCERFANEKLKRKGFLFLNEVYEMLGFPCTPEGQLVGWTYSKNNPVGDNYVDFGLYDVNKRSSRDFVNGYEKAVLLDFNIEGNILNKMA